MKMTISILVWFSFSFIAGCGDNKNKKPERLKGSEELIFHRNEKAGFTVKYPRVWDTTSTDPRASFVARNTAKDDDDFRESMTVIRLDVIRTGTLPELSAYATRELLNTYPGSVIYSDQIAKNREGQDFVLLEMNMEVEKKEILTMEAFYPRGKHLYMLTMMADKEDFYDYKILFREMADNFFYHKLP